MDKKKPMKGRSATAKKITIKTVSKKTHVKKKRVAVGKTKTEKKIAARKIVIKGNKKVEVKANQEKAAGKPKKKESKKVAIKKEKKVEKKQVAKKAEKKVASPLRKKVEAKKVTTKPQKKITAARVVLSKKAAPERTKTVSLYGKEERYPPLPVDILSEEYGEDSIALMIVDPKKLFIYWEVVEDTFKKHEGILKIRLYDITGVNFDGMVVSSYADITIHDRIGNLYLDVDPEKEFIADIGVIDSEGYFVIVARSNKASTPPAEILEKGILPHRLYETGLETSLPTPPIGYER
jgi:hypothetical protein